MKVKITKECMCEHYLHELTNYPREGLDKMEKTFHVGEEYEVIEKWNNFYGSYYRVEGDNKTHDLSIENCIIV